MGRYLIYSSLSLLARHNNYYANNALIYKIYIT